MEKQELTSAIIKYNRQTNEAIGTIQHYLKKIEDYRPSFAEQRQIIARLDMSKRVLTAAINNLENLRPRIYMIEDNEAVSRKQKKGQKK